MQQEVKTFTNKSNKALASVIQSHDSVFYSLFIIVHDHLLCFFIFINEKKSASRLIDCLALWVMMEPNEKNIFPSHILLKHPWASRTNN